jgi:hypothetical protein
MQEYAMPAPLSSFPRRRESSAFSLSPQSTKSLDSRLRGNDEREGCRITSEIFEYAATKSFLGFSFVSFVVNRLLLHLTLFASRFRDT